MGMTDPSGMSLIPANFPYLPPSDFTSYFYVVKFYSTFKN